MAGGAALVGACAPLVDEAAPGPAARPALAADPALGIWPSAIARAPSQVREAYAFAVKNEATLRWIPCYCGCGAQGHRDNFDCYVREVRRDGWVVLDTHGLG